MSKYHGRPLYRFISFQRRRLEYPKAVNGLRRGDGSREGQRQYRARVEQLRQEYIRQRELEIEKITGEDY